MNQVSFKTLEQLNTKVDENTSRCIENAESIKKIEAKLNTLGDNLASSSTTVPVSNLSIAELLISTIPEQVADELSPLKVSTKVLKKLNLSSLTSDIFSVRKFTNTNLKKKFYRWQTTFTFLYFKHVF